MVESAELEIRSYVSELDRGRQIGGSGSPTGTDVREPLT
jgi:hypothetical protein